MRRSGVAGIGNLGFEPLANHSQPKTFLGQHTEMLFVVKRSPDPVCVYRYVVIQYFVPSAAFCG